MPNENLQNAKKAKNDEFYTQYTDIEREINAYLEYNPDVFRGKTILLPCDDPSKTRVRGKIFVLDHDTNQNGKIDIDDLEYSYFRSHWLEN